MKRLGLVHRTLWGIVAALAAAASVASAAAQTPAVPPPALPTDPDQWLNSNPLTYEGMHGKAVVLWYFEETCPRCRKRWPELLALAESYAKQPVLFVGVNSGSDGKRIAAYAQQQRIDWPIILDGDRSFEQASGVKEISLQNIWSVRVILPTGEFATGRWDDLPGTVEKILKGAAWSGDFADTPPELQTLVRRMEFGDYQPAAFAIRYKLRDASPTEKRALEAMRDQLQGKMQEQLTAALADVPADDPWLQYAAYDAVAQRFAPLDLPKEAAAQWKSLRNDPVVKKEILVAKAIAANAPGLSSPDERIRNRSVSRLQSLVKRYPETQGAKRAKELLGE